MGDLSKNFSRSEFVCSCGCGSDNISPVLVDMLQVAREDLAESMGITSGVRCKAHNASVGGADTSAHVPADLGAGEYGHAVDIGTPSSLYRFRLIQALYRAGFSRIGDGDGFIHVDIDTRKPQNVFFNYYK